MRKNKLVLIIGLSIFLLASIGGIITFAIFSSNANAKIRGYLEINAEVIEIIKHEPGSALGSSNGTFTYSPVFEFEINGNIYKHESNIWTSAPIEKIGDIVTVFVNPDNPYDVITTSIVGTYQIGIVFCTMFGIIVLVFLLAGLISFKNDESIAFIILPSMLFFFGSLAIILPAITSGYKTIKKMLAADLTMTIIGSILIGLGLLFAMIFSISVILNYFDNRIKKDKKRIE